MAPPIDFYITGTTNLPMTMHLIKLSVGPESLADLAAWQAQRLKDLARRRQTPELMHITRATPKQAAEVLNGGSIYWVIKGFVCARQRLLDLRPLLVDGMPHCGLVYDKELVRITPRPHRPFQGWRYLDPKDAPPDLTIRAGDAEMTEAMLRDLAKLGLL